MELEGRVTAVDLVLLMLRIFHDQQLHTSRKRLVTIEVVSGWDQVDQDQAQGLAYLQRRGGAGPSLPALHTLHSSSFAPTPSGPGSASEMDMNSRNASMSPVATQRPHWRQSGASGGGIGPSPHSPAPNPNVAGPTTISTTRRHHQMDHRERERDLLNQHPQQQQQQQQYRERLPLFFTSPDESGPGGAGVPDFTTTPIEDVISRDRFVSLFGGMYDSLIDARRVRSWIDDQQRLRADSGASAGGGGGGAPVTMNGRNGGGRRRT